MGEENKQEKIDNRMLEIYNELKNNEDSGYINIQDITYYNDLTLIQPQSETVGIAEQGVYLVKIVDENERVLYNVFNENMQIATIDDNGKIQFSENYEQFLQKIDPRFLDAIKNANNKIVKLPEELSEDDIIYEPEDIETVRKKKEQESEEAKDELEENTKEDNEVNLDKIAKTTGMKREDINSYSMIKPTEKVTDKDTFEDVASVSGKYSKIYVISANKATDKNRKFAFIGITKDGEAEYIDDLETRGTTTTDKKIYSINRDGTSVEEKQTTEMFTTKNQDKMFSVTIGQYGILEVDYLRRSSTENKFIGSSVETQAQRPTTRQVKEFMNTSRTSNYEFSEAIRNTEEQIQENGSETTELQNIDDNPYNDKAPDIDEVIRLHDGTRTTIREQANKHGKSPEEYVNIIENTQGDCNSEKIEKANIEIEEDEEPSREERSTPEEEALKKL